VNRARPIHGDGTESVEIHGKPGPHGATDGDEYGGAVYIAMVLTYKKSADVENSIAISPATTIVDTTNTYFHHGTV